MARNTALLQTAIGRVFKTVKALEQAIEAYLAEHNANPKPFRWTATADLIPRRVEDARKRTLNSGQWRPSTDGIATRLRPPAAGG